MNDEQMHYSLYILAEISYKHAHPDTDEDDLFPFGWYATRNYKLKTEIIAEALKKGIDVTETELYQQTLPGLF